MTSFEQLSPILGDGNPELGKHLEAASKRRKHRYQPGDLGRAIWEYAQSYIDSPLPRPVEPVQSQNLAENIDLSLAHGHDNLTDTPY